MAFESRRVIHVVDEIPKGAKRIHFYSIKNILRPRGGVMEKESLSEVIYERMKLAFDSWTDPKYADSKKPVIVYRQIMKNLEEEVAIAIQKFEKEISEE